MNGSKALKEQLQRILQPAGIIINGPNPWDPQIFDERFYARVISKQSLGLGEAYMDGWFDIAQPDEFFFRVLRADLDHSVRPGSVLPFLKSLLINEQSRSRSRTVVQQHYDLSTELFMSFLDPYNQYTCCYFPEGNETLDEAAQKKLKLICDKLQLSASDKVLDVGCGWGGFAKFAAEHYGCHVTGISISEEQLKFARQFCNGLPTEFHYADYRDIRGNYDKILVCGMIEHVGYKNYRKLMRIVSNCLNDNGLFLLQTIGRNDTATSGDAWLKKYIFPNSQLPSIKQISNAAEGCLVMEDWQNLGPHYYPTLMGWHGNFVKNWPQLQSRNHLYDERFYRMWTYYLLSCAGAFKARSIQLWQAVFSKRGIEGGYKAIR